jgi:hypothetical protein
MKKIDSMYGKETSVYFALKLTHVPLLWNHAKTVVVAQALLPVRFSGECKLPLNPVLAFDREAARGLRSRSLFAR